MNSWFEVLPGGSDVEILNPGDMLHLFAARLRPTTVLQGMDNPTNFNSKLLQRFRNLLLTAQQVDLASSERKITVVDRLSSGSFNKTPAAEVPASGQAVRSTPNLSTLARKFLGSFETPPWAIVDAAKISPQQQLQTFASTSLLIAQHGAGLANMLWMPSGGTVVEIQPPRPTYEPPFFRNLAAACGHSYLRVSQQHDHADVPEEEFRAAVWTALRKDAAS